MKNNKETVKTPENNVTVRSMVWGTIIAALFAFLTVVLENRRSMLPTANQIPLFPYVLLALSVLLINPLLRLIRFIRPFSLCELMVVFVMGMVSSGISTFGLTGQVIPIISGIYNRHWNNNQTEWNKYIEPYINEDFFISEKGIQKAATEYAEHALALANLKTQLPDKEHQEEWRRKIQELSEVTEQKHKVLAALENEAFAKVELYRRGLPRDKRAIPGIIFTTDDTPSTYFRRLGRLRAGRKAAAIIRELDNAVNPQQALRDAVELLKPYADTTAPEARINHINLINDALNTEIAAIDNKLLKLNQDKRVASMDDARRMEDEIDDLNSERERLANKITKNSKRRERSDAEFEICIRVKTACDSLLALADKWDQGNQGDQGDKGDNLAKAEDILATFPAFDASLTRYLIGDVPWSHWAKPLFYWAIIVGLTYLILYTFNILIFRQWAYNEKLIFPLAELPETMAGLESGSQTSNMIPDLFKNGLFWVGFAIAAGVMGWNLLCNTGLMPGLTPLNLTNSWTPFIRTSMFKGLCYGARSAVFFTMIGLAFLIPQKVSFSLWFFHIMYMILLLALAALGYGQNESSFPSEWWYTQNFRSGIGAGALIVFATLVLWKCRDVLLCAIRPDRLENVTPDEAHELRISSTLFLIASCALILALWGLLGVNFFYAVFGYITIMIFTIGLIRVVAEGGVLSFQSHASPFHLIRHIIGMDKSYTAPHLYAPLMIFYSVLFLDLKTFIAPAMANSLKISDDLKMSRKRYHLSMLLGIVVSVVVAITVAIILCYDSGADAMQSWFYTFFPKNTYSLIGSISKVPPMATSAGRGWLLSGALLMAVLLYFRQNNFWLPHPIGLIMLVNPLMEGVWFSILLGWLAKSLVTKYANKETYTKVRGLFIGLILGEFFIIMLAMILSLAMGKNLGGVTLNR